MGEGVKDGRRAGEEYGKRGKEIKKTVHGKRKRKMLWRIWKSEGPGRGKGKIWEGVKEGRRDGK